jgi:hypothetical protein
MNPSSTAAALIATLLISCCWAGSSSAAPVRAHGTTPASPPTVWLCQPGQSRFQDPCLDPLQSTVVPAAGKRITQDSQAATGSKFDCFYVYPTVSTQPGDNANLNVQSDEVAAAISEASRFSQVCNVWAPMYRQRTVASLQQGIGADQRGNYIAYESVLSAFRNYLANYNHGRPIVFIGHSQGAAMLIRLLSSQVDRNRSLRAHTVVAILAGGNVAVPTGRSVGATFRHLPLCKTITQTGCVIAYSSFPSQPPVGSLFGRPGTGVSLQSGQSATRGVQVACVNPAAIAGGSADLDSYFPSATSTAPLSQVKTPWVSYPDLYSATCMHAGGATWLQVSTLTVAGRPVVTESLGPNWGYHLDDINLALGNLVGDVQAEEAAYAAKKR